MTADVVVVGSRVAGSATAMLLARAGHDVVVLDRTRHPSDTLSTHALARGGVVQLARWGLLDDVLATGAPPVRSVAFHSAEGIVRRTVRCTAGIDHLIAPRRHALDPVLVDAAASAGARVLEGVTVEGVRRDPAGRVVGVAARTEAGEQLEVAARHVVGADGVRSTVARRVGAEVVHERPSTGGCHYLYATGLRDADGAAEVEIEYHLDGGAFAGVFPTNGGESCVWVCAPGSWTAGLRGPGRGAAFLEVLARVSPSLAARVAAAPGASPVRGAVGLPNHLRRPAGPGWWLVGDASHHRDPITGHGITDALRDAELLAVELDGVLRGRTDERSAARRYRLARDTAARPVFDLTCRLAAFPPRPRFVELQKELSGVLEEEALALAARPVPFGTDPFGKAAAGVGMEH